MGQQQQPLGQTFGPAAQTDETFLVEKGCLAPDLPPPAALSATSAPQSPEHDDDDESAATRCQIPPETYESVACTNPEKQHVYQAN